MIKGYKVVSTRSLHLFNDAVNKAITEGWQPFGSVSVTEVVTLSKTLVTFSQAMVKYEES